MLLLAPWLIINAAQIMIAVILVIYIMYLVPAILYIFILWIPLIYIALSIHWWLVVYAFYQEIRDEIEGRRGHDGEQPTLMKSIN